MYGVSFIHVALLLAVYATQPWSKHRQTGIDRLTNTVVIRTAEQSVAVPWVINAIYYVLPLFLIIIGTLIIIFGAALFAINKPH
jgi:hypothetical protein